MDEGISGLMGKRHPTKPTIQHPNKKGAPKNQSAC
jgi:hypothetical protein